MADKAGIPLRSGDVSVQVYSEERSEHRCRICPKEWDACTACLLVLGMLTTAAVIAFAGLTIGLSVTIADPHIKILNYVAGNCTVVNSSFTGNRPSCACYGAPRCRATYPCLAVTVKYRTRDGPVVESMLHDDEHVFTYRPHCSYQPSSCSEGYNPNSVSGFQYEFGKPGRSFPCFHDPNGPGALLTRTRGTSFVVHIILWPLLFTVIFAILWCVIFCCCCPKAQRAAVGQ